MKSKRSKACDISQKVRAIVTERDKWCIFCGHTGNQMCHLRPRSSGGLGIPENLVLGCFTCHMKLDQSTHRKEMLEFALNHLSKHYPNFNDEDRYYHK